MERAYVQAGAGEGYPGYAPVCPYCLSGLFLLEGDVQMTASIDLLHPDGKPDWAEDWIRIVGTEGSLEAHPTHGTFRLIGKGKDEELHKVTAVAPPMYTPFIRGYSEQTVAREQHVIAESNKMTTGWYTVETGKQGGRLWLKVDAIIIKTTDAAALEAWHFIFHMRGTSERIAVCGPRTLELTERTEWTEADRLGYCHSAERGTAKSFSPNGTISLPAYKTIPHCKSLPVASCNSLNPLKSPLSTRVDVFTSSLPRWHRVARG